MNNCSSSLCQSHSRPLMSHPMLLVLDRSVRYIKLNLFINKQISKLLWSPFDLLMLELPSNEIFPWTQDDYISSCSASAIIIKGSRISFENSILATGIERINNDFWLFAVLIWLVVAKGEMFVVLTMLPLLRLLYFESYAVSAMFGVSSTFTRKN